MSSCSGPAAFARAVRGLEEELGGDPADWGWGRLHVLQPTHALGSKVGAYNLDGLPAPGSSTSVWKSQIDLGDPDHPFRALYGPVLRMVVDLADIRHASWIIDTGSSGWPHSPHYDDQHEAWRNVEFAPMISDGEEIRRDATAVLLLR